MEMLQSECLLRSLEQMAILFVKYLLKICEKGLFLTNYEK